MINKDSDIEIIISKYLSKEAIPEEIKVLDDWISAGPPKHKRFFLKFLRLLPKTIGAFYHKRMCGKSVTRLLIRKR